MTEKGGEHTPNENFFVHNELLTSSKIPQRRIIKDILFVLFYFHTNKIVRNYEYLSQTTGLIKEHGISFHRPQLLVFDSIHVSLLPEKSFGSPVFQLV